MKSTVFGIFTSDTVPLQNGLALASVKDAASNACEKGEEAARCNASYCPNFV